MDVSYNVIEFFSNEIRNVDVVGGYVFFYVSENCYFGFIFLLFYFFDVVVECFVNYVVVVVGYFKKFEIFFFGWGYVVSYWVNFVWIYGVCVGIVWEFEYVYGKCIWVLKCFWIKYLK